MSSTNLSTKDKATEYLNAIHKNQVVKYMKFFQYKTIEHKKEILYAIDEIRDTKMNDNMYTRNDVNEILECLKEEADEVITDELNKFTKQTVLYLRQLFLQAEGHKINLSVDLHSLDDAILLAKIEKLDIDSKLNIPDRKKTKLSSLLNNNIDISLVTQIKDLENKYNQLLEQNNTLQQQLNLSNDQNIELKKEMNQLINDNEENLKVKVVQLTEKLHIAQNELATKLRQTKQFTQLKALMQQKNTEIRQLKKQLAEINENL